MIEKRSLGQNGAEMGRLGYGAMVLEGYYGASDDEQGVATIHRALDVGMNLIDTDVRLDEATLRRIDDLARPGLAEGATLV